MTIRDQLLALFFLYGLPVLFGVTVFNAIGIPLPGTTFLLIASGSFARQGGMNLGWVIGLAISGAILGDQVGYGVGRWGGRHLVFRVSKWCGGEKRLDQAKAFAKKWGGVGIFLSRWLITPLGPLLNYTSGITAYAYPRFLAWEISGEVVWVLLYVMLGVIFSDRVQALIEMLGNLSWAAAGVIAAILFGWMLIKNFRNGHNVLKGTKR